VDEWKPLIPGSTNSWEAIYSVPEMDAARVAELVDSPYQVGGVEGGRRSFIELKGTGIL